jgi:hypothetical protein
MMLLQIQNLHSEASKIRFEATNTLSNYETYAHNSKVTFNQAARSNPYSSVPNGGAQAIDTYKATRSLIAAGESIMQQNKSALDKVPGGKTGMYEPTKYITTHSKMYPLTKEFNTGSNPIQMISSSNFVQDKPSARKEPVFTNLDDPEDEAFVDLREIERMTA